MADPPQNRRTSLFTLRLWRQDMGDGQMEWRGQARKVLNGEVMYFREWSKLSWFLLEQLSSSEDADFLTGARDDDVGM